MYTTYVARQPILNAKRHTLGYELLFRDGEKTRFLSTWMPIVQPIV